MDILPFDVQKIIYRLLYDSTMHQLRNITEDIYVLFEDNIYRDCYKVGKMELTLCYEYRYITGLFWILFLGSGKHFSSNANQIRNYVQTKS